MVFCVTVLFALASVIIIVSGSHYQYGSHWNIFLQIFKVITYRRKKGGQLPFGRRKIHNIRIMITTFSPPFPFHFSEILTFQVHWNACFIQFVWFEKLFYLSISNETTKTFVRHRLFWRHFVILLRKYVRDIRLHTNVLFTEFFPWKWDRVNEMQLDSFPGGYHTK